MAKAPTDAELVPHRKAPSLRSQRVPRRLIAMNLRNKSGKDGELHGVESFNSLQWRKMTSSGAKRLMVFTATYAHFEKRAAKIHPQQPERNRNKDQVFISKEIKNLFIFELIARNKFKPYSVQNYLLAKN